MMALVADGNRARQPRLGAVLDRAFGPKQIGRH